MTKQKTRRVTKQDADIGFRIRQARQSKKMTQIEVATLLNITYQQLQKYELGRNRVSAERLGLIATILNVDANDLLRAANDKLSNLPSRKPTRYELDQKAARLWREIQDNRHKSAIVELMDILRGASPPQPVDMNTPD